MRSGTRRIIPFLLIILALWAAVRYLLPLTLPFLLGMGLALAAEPMVRFFRKRMGLPRPMASGIAVTMSFCFLALLALLLCALIVRELGALAGVLPDLGQAARAGLTTLEQQLSGFSDRLPQSLQPLARQGVASFFSDGNAMLDRVTRYLLNLAGSILGHIPDSALGIGTAIISGYMISAKLPGIRQFTLRHLPREKLRPILQTLKRLRKTLLRFLTAQVQLSGVTFGILLTGFLLLRIRYAPLWAAAVSLVDAFPVLGTGSVLLPWALVALLQGHSAQALGLCGIYITVAVIRSVLEPKLLGKHLGLDPLVTLMAIYAGYKLWGIGGMLLSPMLAVTILQLFRENQGHDGGMQQ